MVPRWQTKVALAAAFVITAGSLAFLPVRGADEPNRTKEVKAQPTTSGGVAAPKTIGEGLAQIEKTLGKYDANDQHEWRVPMKMEYKSRPQPDKPEVLACFDGMTVVGHPFLSSDSICFDEVMQWKREVYDLGDGGKRALTRFQRSHNVSRYLLTLKEGVWLVSGAMLSNGVHNSIGKTTFSGVMRWHADGFELVGDNGVDRYYGPGGSWVLGTAYGSVRYSREGDRLVVRQQFQPYHLATAPDGTQTMGPDFNRPFGSVYSLESRSEPPSSGDGK